MALCVRDSQYINKFNIYFKNSASNFIDHLKRISEPTKQVFMGIAKDSIGEMIPLTMVIHVFDVVADLTLMSEDEVKRFSKSIEKNLSEQARRDKILLDIEKGKKLVMAGQENEGIAVFKSITFHSSEQMPTMRHAMNSVFVETTGFSSGIKAIDNDTGGWLLKNMVSIAGDSGSQKTMVSLWLVLKALIANPHFKCLYFEKEMPITDIARRLISHLLTIDSKEIMKMTNQQGSYGKELLEMSRNVRAEMEDNKSALADAMNRLIPIERNMFKNAHDMWELVESYDANMWVLDYATMLQPSSGKIDDESMRNEFVTIKEMLETTNTFGIVLSQLKQSNGVDSRNNKIPLIGDMEWGKHLRQFSAWVFSIFYPHYYGYKQAEENWFYLISRKTRHGNPLNIPLLSYPSYCDFREPDFMIEADMREYLQTYMRSNLK